MTTPGEALIRNERLKMTAGLLNTLAGFSLTAGAIAPLIALSYGISAAPAGSPLALSALVLTWLLVGSVFHWAARRLLGRLIVTASEIIAFYGAPLSLLAVGMAFYFWSSYADR